MKKTYKDLYRSKGIKISIYHINIYYSQNSEIQKKYHLETFTIIITHEPQGITYMSMYLLCV